MNIIQMTRVAELYDMNENAVLVQYSKVYTLPDGTNVVGGKIYRCKSGESVEQLMRKLEDDNKVALGFNADKREIFQTSAV